MFPLYEVGLANDSKFGANALFSWWGSPSRVSAYDFNTTGHPPAFTSKIHRPFAAAMYVDLARGCNPSNTGALLRQETLLDRATSNNREN